MAISCEQQRLVSCNTLLNCVWGSHPVAALAGEERIMHRDDPRGPALRSSSCASIPVLSGKQPPQMASRSSSSWAALPAELLQHAFGFLSNEDRWVGWLGGVSGSGGAGGRRQPAGRVELLGPTPRRLFGRTESAACARACLCVQAADAGRVLQLVWRAAGGARPRAYRGAHWRECGCPASAGSYSETAHHPAEA